MGICKVKTSMSLYLHCLYVNYYKETDVLWICFFCGKNQTGRDISKINKHTLNLLKTLIKTLLLDLLMSI